MLLSNPRSPQSNHLHTTQSMRLGICGKARRATRISISWANSLSKVNCLNCEKWAVKCMHKAWVGGLHVSPTAWFFTNVPTLTVHCVVWRWGQTEWQLHPSQQDQRRAEEGRTEHLNPILKNSLTTSRFCGNSLLMLLCLWSVSSHLLSPCSSYHGWQKKIPFLIISDRAWPRLPLRRPHAGLVLLRPQGVRMKFHKHAQAKILPQDTICSTFYTPGPRLCGFRWWCGERSEICWSYRLWGKGLRVS